MVCFLFSVVALTAAASAHAQGGVVGSRLDSTRQAQPTRSGQEAFATIGEIVRILEADPRTDWSKVNIEALRHHRTHSKWTNWMKDLRTEMIQIIYEQPIYPKNLYADRAPMKHAEYAREVTERQIALMLERDIWKRPSGA